jgi:peptide chain release factor 1
MFEKLEGLEKRLAEVEKALSDPAVLQDREKYQKFSREHSELAKVVSAFHALRQTMQQMEESRQLLHDGDGEIRELARVELEGLEARQEAEERALHALMLPRDPLDEKNVILEIRAGTGGDEAALFANDLYRMYSRFAEGRGWKVEIMTHHATGGGGLKEIIAMISGQGAYSIFKYESGTHRVQRVPVTETQGRIHTSAVTVAVLPEAEEVEVRIDPTEIKVDVYRSSGPGGQSVNTTDSAVRVTHLPTGLVVTCQDEKSQWKNKAKAMKVLRSRLLDRLVSERNEKRSEDRKSQVGSGDRSGRIRTYNFPQGRVTDHRIGLTLYRLDAVLQGDLDTIVTGLATHYQTQALQNDQLL